MNEKQKKPIYKRWWFWVIVILVIGAIGSSVGDEEAEKADKQKDETKETKQVEEKPTEEETEEVYIVGDSFDVGELGVKIKEVEEKTEFTSDNMFVDDITTEGKFITITAELTNNGKEEVSFSNSQFKLIDNQEREFETYSGAGLMTILGDNYLFLESCNPGMSRTGIFVFEVPESVEAYSLLVREKAFGGKKATVKLK